MQVNRISDVNQNPNFQAKITIEKPVLNRLIGKEFCNVNAKSSHYFSYQYSPLKQRKILYNILSQIKNDNKHKLCEISGGKILDKEHIIVNLDGKIGARCSMFPVRSVNDCNAAYIEKLLDIAKKMYPQEEFTKDSLFSELANKIKKVIYNKNYPDKEYENLAKKIRKLLD